MIIRTRARQVVDWQLELISPAGRVLRRWQGSTPLAREPVSVPVAWSGRDAGQLAAGVYSVRLRAGSRGATSNAPAQGRARTDLADRHRQARDAAAAAFRPAAG
ncbi:hypothetical protein [Massilia sp. Se16.2.3]|uniref:hypothetical protein n=1 Tax=Massilia sp. Se16.2.3 TaxID=2709303 RepID=UPI001E641862|nr:hypothetical protein [Massilia sp. Se16.2.3]